jgi:apolipoprotein N-acyltransferase
VRAIEAGSWVLVASTNGISGVISPDGDVVQRAEVGVRAVLTATINPSADRTMASRLGAWPEWVITTGGLAGLAVAIRRHRRARRRTATRGKDRVHA